MRHQYLTLNNYRLRKFHILSLRGPTHQKWSNLANFGFIVQFDPWVGAHLWKKIRVLGALETPQ